MNLDNSVIELLLTKCCRNDRQSQKQLFFLLREFALRICYRYSSIEEDPTISMYSGFVKLFKKIMKIGIIPNTDLFCDLKSRFKVILIDTCIENGKRYEQRASGDLLTLNAGFIAINEIGRFRNLSAKEIIDSLRRLSYLCRMVFNLSVIDSFTIQDISNKLEIPVTILKSNLNKSKENIKKLIQSINGRQY